MAIDLFDIQVGIIGARPGERGEVTVDSLLAMMERFDIGQALVRVAPTDFETDVVFSNAKLYEACSEHPNLVPCPVVVPNTAGDFPSEAEQVDDALAHGAGAVWIRVNTDCWFVAEWISDRLFGVLSDRRMPTYVGGGALSSKEVADLAGRFGDLPIILAGAGYSDQRVLLPLLERFANIYLSIGSNYRVYNGVEQFVERLGAGRLLFGSGFPDSEPMASGMYLLYADISEEQKRRIGSGNAEHLIEGIKR